MQKAASDWKLIIPATVLLGVAEYLGWASRVRVLSAFIWAVLLVAWIVNMVNSMQPRPATTSEYDPNDVTRIDDSDLG